MGEINSRGSHVCEGSDHQAEGVSQVLIASAQAKTRRFLWEIYNRWHLSRSAGSHTGKESAPYGPYRCKSCRASDNTNIRQVMQLSLLRSRPTCSPYEHIHSACGEASINPSGSRPVTFQIPDATGFQSSDRPSPSSSAAAKSTQRTSAASSSRMLRASWHRPRAQTCSRRSFHWQASPRCPVTT